MTEKIIQVSGFGVENTSSTQCNYMLVGLTDKGRVVLSMGDREWADVSPKKDSKEIPLDEPMSAEEWLSWYDGPAELDPEEQYTNIDMVKAFDAGAAENEKKHRLQQSFGGWLSETIDVKYANTQHLKMAWQAHAKATNTES